MQKLAFHSWQVTYTKWLADRSLIWHINFNEIFISIKIDINNDDCFDSEKLHICTN